MILLRSLDMSPSGPRTSDLFGCKECGQIMAYGMPEETEYEYLGLPDAIFYNTVIAKVEDSSYYCVFAEDVEVTRDLLEMWFKYYDHNFIHSLRLTIIEE